MKTQILTILFLLGMSFGTANATLACTEIHVIPVQDTLQSCEDGQSATVEVVIHNPEYCYSNINSITLSDSANFELNTSFGAVPCGSDTFNLRGYQFCTVGVTFKPVTTSGTFETDINVGTIDTPIMTATIDGEVLDTIKLTTCSCAKKHRNGKHGKSCDNGKHGQNGKHGKSCDNGKHGQNGKHGKSCDNGKHGHNGKHGKSCGNNGDNGKHGKSYSKRNNRICVTTCEVPKVETLYNADSTNYLANLNLLDSGLFASQISILGDTVMFDNYNENIVGLATFKLDQEINFTSMLTFTANIENGLFMPRMSGGTGTYMTTDIRKTQQYGFIFPSTIPLSTLNFTTWNLSFTGSIVDLSIVEVSNTNILAKDP